MCTHIHTHTKKHLLCSFWGPGNCEGRGLMICFRVSLWSSCVGHSLRRLDWGWQGNSFAGSSSPLGLFTVWLPLGEESEGEQVKGNMQDRICNIRQSPYRNTIRLLWATQPSVVSKIMNARRKRWLGASLEARCMGGRVTRCSSDSQE